MSFRFLMSEVGTGIRRNFSMFVSVILVSFISLVFVGIAGLLQMQVNHLSQELNRDVQVFVYMCTNDDKGRKDTCSDGEVTSTQRKAIQDKLEGKDLEPYVQSANYVSKKQAYERYQSREGNEDLAEVVTEEDMPTSYDVSLKPDEAKQFTVIKEQLENMPGVETVYDQEGVLSSIFDTYDALMLVAIGLAIIMLICAILLIASTIRQSAFSRRREIGIMRLVGASKSTIGLPFILEAVLATVIGGVLAILALYLIMTYYQNSLTSGSELATSSMIPLSSLWTIGPILLIIAIVVAVLSSMITLRRYLKI